jgi:ferredoxin
MTHARNPGPPGPAAPGAGAPRLRVNPIACSGHGSCADLLPELVALDEWGYPLLADTPVPPELSRRARRAVRDCPALALRLAAGPEPGRR